MRITKSKTGSRRSHDRAPVMALAHDKESGVTYPRHFMNPETGEYRGNKIVDVTGREQKKAVKQEQKAEATKQETAAEAQKTEEAENKETAEKSEPKAEKKEEK